jgi:hypothetical protein
MARGSDNSCRVGGRNSFCGYGWASPEKAELASGARQGFGRPDEDAGEVGTPTRQFSLLEITSGLPDDSREADERAAERRLRDLRARVKAARAVVTSTSGLAQALARDWRKAARLYARFGITEQVFRQGARSTPLERAE